MDARISQVTVDIDRAFGSARDFDVTRSGAWVGVFESKPRGHNVHFEDSTYFDLSSELTFPAIRFLGPERVLVADRRTVKGRANGHILGRDGTILTQFFAGDGIQDVVVLGDLFAVTYFDEGVFSGQSPSDQGIAFFDFDGNYRWGYQSLMGEDAVDIADCYCAARVDHHTMAFSAYTDFKLVRLQPGLRKQWLDDILPTLRGASALSIRGEDVLLYDPYDRRKALFTWRPGVEPVEIGRHSGPLRGLEWGRFLSCGTHGFTIVEVAA